MWLTPFLAGFSAGNLLPYGSSSSMWRRWGREKGELHFLRSSICSGYLEPISGLGIAYPILNWLQFKQFAPYGSSCFLHVKGSEEVLKGLAPRVALSLHLGSPARLQTAYPIPFKSLHLPLPQPPFYWFTPLPPAQSNIVPGTSHFLRSAFK